MQEFGYDKKHLSLKHKRFHIFWVKKCRENISLKWPRVIWSTTLPLYLTSISRIHTKHTASGRFFVLSTATAVKFYLYTAAVTAVREWWSGQTRSSYVGRTVVRLQYSYKVEGNPLPIYSSLRYGNVMYCTAKCKTTTVSYSSYCNLESLRFLV